jgi:DNA-directed RNA polymerase sigma subunit (sigma70/sigma32)
MKDRHDADNRLHDFYDESEAYDGERRQKVRESESTPILTLYKFRGPIPSPDEERDLLRAAQAGDADARARLVECFHRLVLSIASDTAPRATN